MVEGVFQGIVKHVTMALVHVKGLLISKSRPVAEARKELPGIKKFLQASERLALQLKQPFLPQLIFL